jgi:hypothetical protein
MVSCEGVIPDVTLRSAALWQPRLGGLSPPTAIPGQERHAASRGKCQTRVNSQFFPFMGRSIPSGEHRREEARLSPLPPAARLSCEGTLQKRDRTLGNPWKAEGFSVLGCSLAASIAAGDKPFAAGVLRWHASCQTLPAGEKPRHLNQSLKLKCMPALSKSCGHESCRPETGGGPQECRSRLSRFNRKADHV